MSFKEWREVKLGDVLNFRRGHDLPKRNMIDGEIPVIGSNGIIGYHNKYTTESPCVTIGRSGNVGNPHIIQHKAWAHNTTLYIDDYKENCPEFIYYFLKSLNLQNYRGGSAVPTLNRNHIHPIKIKFPDSFEEQKAIAHILSTLDDKIEINNRINKTLEEMAQAIFKRWFVEFEFPDENGKPYKSSGGDMVESELGMIPKGWEVKRVKEFADVVGGSTPSKKKQCYYTEKGIPWITPKDLSIKKTRYISKGEIDITEDGFKNSSTKILNKGAILFSSRAPIGYIAIAKNELTTNQGFKSLVPLDGISNQFIYYMIKHYTPIIENHASGSTFKEISGSAMKEIKFYIPQKDLIERFHNAIIGFSNKIEKKEEEISILKDIRDALLPKLMSGEIRVDA